MCIIKQHRCLLAIYNCFHTIGNGMENLWNLYLKINLSFTIKDETYLSEITFINIVIFLST